MNIRMCSSPGFGSGDGAGGRGGHVAFGNGKASVNVGYGTSPSGPTVGFTYKF